MTRASCTVPVIADHGQLITWAMRRLHVRPHEREDGAQGGAVGLLVALERFDPTKGNYRSFAASHVLHEVRIASGMTRKRQLRMVELETDERHVRVGYDEDGFEAAERSDAVDAAGRYLASLADDDAYVARRFYEDGASQTQIAAELGTNKMAVSRRVRRIEAAARVALARFAPAA